MNKMNLDKINELISIKEFATAKAELEKMLKVEPKNIEALKVLGLCNINLGFFQEGKNNFETVVKYKNEDAASWFYLANCYDSLDDFRHAQTAYLEVIKLRENYFDAYKNLGVMYIKTKEHVKALEISQKALLMVEDDYLFYYLAGTALLAMKDSKSSIPYFEKALNLNPEHAQLYNNLGTAYLTTGQYDKAYEKYMTAITLDAKNSLTYYNIASILQIKNRHIEACEYFKKAYEIEKVEHYLVSLALSEFKSEQYEAAIEHYKGLVSQHPEKHNFQYNLACCYEMIGEYSYAIGILDQLALLNPKSKMMMQKLANLYLKTNQPLKAKEIYERIINQGIVSSDIYYEYALICVNTGDIDIAETILKKVIELEPEMALGHKDLGVIYLNKRLFDYARDEFEQAYKLAPEDVGIIFEYANFLHSTSDFATARVFYKKALEKNPENPAVLVFGAINEQALNNLNEALNYIQQAVKICPGDDFVLYSAGKIYYDLKDFENSTQLLLRAHEINPIIEVENLLGLNYYAQGEYEKANDIFVKLLKTSPMNTNLLLNSAKCYEKLSDIKLAKKQLKSILKMFPEMEEAKSLLDSLKKQGDL